ncbi:MAG: MFS transporter [Rhodospirillaceae bacterium]|jgi:CP family cyanate transporter-like MFS transporter|nr:MFS transporter [Rhodospirillaceae bacterium]
MAYSPTGATSEEGSNKSNFRWLVLFGIWLVYFCFGLSVASLAPLVQVIELDLSIEHALMGTILGAWPVVYIASSLPCGALLDRYGTSVMLVASTLIIALAIALRGFAETYFDLLFTMVLFGLVAPIISTGAPKVISIWFTGKERGLGTGVYFTGNALGGITALALSNSFLLPMLGNNWRNIFFIYACFIILAGLIWLIISQNNLYRNIESKIKFDKKIKYRTVIRNLLNQRLIRLVLIMGLFILFFNHGLTQWLPTILVENGMDKVNAGYWSSIPAIIGLISAPIINRWATPQYRLQILMGLFFCAAIATLMIFLNHPSTLFLGLFLQGMCRGAMNGIAILMLIDNEDDKGNNVGASTGLYWTVGEVGGALGPATVGTIASLTGNFDAALFMMTAVAGILIFCASSLIRHKRHQKA